MSTKDAHVLNHWYRMLLLAAEKHGLDASAGEVAKEAGTARSTARRWLDKLVENDAAECYKHIGKNGLPVYRYNIDRR